MAKEAVFTMKLEPELRDAFMAAAQEADRPASQVLREKMREFIEERASYRAFLQRKVDISRRQVEEGKVYSSEEVEAYFARRREALSKTARS